MGVVSAVPTVAVWAVPLAMTIAVATGAGDVESLLHAARKSSTRLQAIAPSIASNRFLP
jgi:hypothetical protein